MGRYNHPLSLDATSMVSKTAQSLVNTLLSFLSQTLGDHSNSMTRFMSKHSLLILINVIKKINDMVKF